MTTALEKAKSICRDNTYLLDEIEVKMIIEAWQSDIDNQLCYDYESIDNKNFSCKRCGKSVKEHF